MGNKRGGRKTTEVESYEHPQAQSPLRPDVGTQAQFKKKLPPKTYRYDPSLSPSLDWDGQNPAREQGEGAIAAANDALRELKRLIGSGELTREQQEQAGKALGQIEESIGKLKNMSRPFLNWTGKAEHLSFDVPTLPLFVHERLSTKAILETVKSHGAKERQITMFDLFGDPRRSITDQILRPYEFGQWNNRLILGDSLVTMNSLLRYESLGGQVQMIYIDPPYGVKFGSNFQPFVRKRDVKHGDDELMTREPEMVQAYRDTWELGLHSYLTYLRDRLLLSRDLLHPSGSIFVQISDENVHHVRELLDDVFGAENFCRIISIAKTSGLGATLLPVTQDYLLWYSKDNQRLKYRQLFVEKLGTSEEEVGMYRYTDKTDRRYRLSDLTGQNNNVSSCIFDFEFEGRTYGLPSTRQWKTTKPGLDALASAGRIVASGNNIYYKRYLDDFPVSSLTDAWSDTGSGGFTEQKIYSVQTNIKVLQRCILMTTDPGELVLDPTCGSGTTAYVAEKWGRRWITMDTSRVPLALVRQRLLTATFPYYELNDEQLGPAGGFVYKRKQNKKGEETGGIIPHVTLRSIAKDESSDEEVLVDRPEELTGITRITAPFSVEATIPTPVDWDGDGIDDTGRGESYGSFVERMIEVLRRSPVLRFNGTRTVTFRNIRPVANTLSLSAEGLVDSSVLHKEPTPEDIVREAEEKNRDMPPASQKPVAFVFGPENGAVSEKLVFEAGREAHAKSYSHLYVIGFAIQPNARSLVENSLDVMGVPATYVQATPDLLMGDLLKNMRSSQIFSVAGLPDVELRKIDSKLYEVELIGLDTFDPVTMEVQHERGRDVPAWLLDSDYNNLCFRVNQAFFPRTEAWNNLKRALKADYEESAWEHLAGTTSAPFEAGENKQVAVKVIDDRGNELLVVKNLEEAE